MDREVEKKVLEQFVKDDNGLVWQVVGTRIDHGKIQIRRRNNYITYKISEFNKKRWRQITKEEYRTFIEEDTAFVTDLTRKLVKRNILSQMLIDLDLELQSDYKGSKNFVSKLKKSCSEAERLMNKQFDQVYAANPTLVTNLMNEIDELVTECSSLRVDDLLFVNKMVKKYKENPEEHQPKEIELTKLRE